MRRVPFKVVILRIWFLYQLQNQSLGVVYALKIGPNDGKVRLVEKGYTQIYGQDSTDTLSCCKNDIYSTSLPLQPTELSFSLT